MYCEIYLKHARNVSGAALVTFLKAQNLGQEMQLPQAYALSRIYRISPPQTSLYAHETLQRCFVILRSVNYDVSSFHLDTREGSVSIETLLEVAEEYVAEQLLPVLSGNPELKASLEAVKLFEDNGRETGLLGKLPGFMTLFLEQFERSEIHSHIIVLLSVFLLVRLGNNQESLLSAGIGLAVALIYAVLNGSLKYVWNRRKIKFGFIER